MATMDIFNNSAFSMTALTGAVDKVQYKPQLLGSMNVFEPMPVRTRTFFVDRRDNVMTLIPNSPIGAPPKELAVNLNNAIPLKSTRLSEGFTLYAEEIQGVRQFGSETELMQVQAEYLRRMGKVRDDMDLTHENHRLGALQGILLDADGTTVIYNYFTEFGVTAPTAINLHLDVTTTNINTILRQMVRATSRRAGGLIDPSTTWHALAGDAFYDALISHPMVERTYLNWQAAAELRNSIGAAFGDFSFGGVIWHNYRGTDDNTTVAIDTAEAILFPVGAREVFKKAMAPAEFGPYVNTLGQDTYAMNIPDRDRQAWTRGELYSYPLYFCQRPDALQTMVMS